MIANLHKRVHHDVVVTAASGKNRTFVIQPKVGPNPRRSLARFTVTDEWIREAVKWHAFFGVREIDPLKDALVQVPDSVIYCLNSQDRATRQRILRFPENRVELREPPPDGRFRFVGYSKDNVLLVHGLADPSILYDLLFVICPMSPFPWDTHKTESRLKDGEVSVEDNWEEA